MNILKLRIYCLLALVLYLTPILANNGLKPISEKEIQIFLDTFNTKTAPVGFYANKDKIAFVFKVFHYIQETESYKKPLHKRFYHKTANFFIVKVKLPSAIIEITKDYIKYGNCTDAFKIHLYKNIGSAYDRLGNLNKSIQAFHQALNHAEKVDDQIQKASIYTHLNYVYWHKDLRQNRTGVSEVRNKISRKCLELFTDQNEIKGIQNACIDLGSSTKDPIESVQFFEKAIKITENNLDKFPYFQSEINYILTNYSRRLLRLNKTEAAFVQIQKINPSYLSNYLDSLDYYLVQAEYQIQLGKTLDAQQTIEKCSPLLKSFEEYDVNLLYSLREFSHLYEILNDHKNLTIVEGQIKQLIGSPNFEDAFFDAEINRFLNEIRNKEQILAKNKSKLSKNRVLLVLVGAFLVLALITTYLYKKLYQTKKRSEALIKVEQQKLVNKNNIIRNKNIYLDKQKSQLEAELKTKLLMLSNKNQMLLSLISEIESLPINYEKKRALIRSIHQNEEKDLWNKVEDEFLDTHKEFVAKLLELNPKLTANNVSLSILIKLGLSNKEIAEVRFTSIESVKVARSRLKKYLNISANNLNLYNFLKKIDTESIESIKSETE